MRPNKSDSSAKAEPFSPIELESIITVAEAAKMRGISRDTFKRHHRDLIRRLSPRREGVKLRDALMICD